MADGQVVFEITADGKKAIASVKDVTAAIEKESNKWDNAVDDAAGGMENSFLSFLKSVAVGFASYKIGEKLIAIGKEAVSAASDLAEVQNVVDVTFGESAAKIEAWSKQAGKQYGLTETAAKRYTSTIGAMLKSQGMADDEIVKTSTDLAGLAADMASFYNLEFDEAFSKIRSGISGETEPLKQLGINMSAANLEAFRLAQGIEKSYSAMSQSEQTALRYQYIMQATADAQGDFARTADGYANASRRMATAMDTIKTKGGQLLLEVVEPLASGFATFLEGLTEVPDRTVLDDIADIEKNAAGKMAQLEAAYNKATDIIGVLDEIGQKTATLTNGSTVTFAELFADIGKIEAGGGDIRSYIEGLGLDVDYIAQKYQVWREATKQLTSDIPELTSVIDAETGAINGGTDAIEENLKAWREGEEKKLAWTTYYAKARALEEKKASLYSYEFDAGAAKQAVKRIQEQISSIVPELGIDWGIAGSLDSESLGKSIETALADKYFGNADKYYDKWNKVRSALVGYTEAQEKAATAQAEYEKQAGAYTDAEQQLADGKAALIEKYGLEEEAATGAANATTEWTAKQKEAGAAVYDTIKALGAYVQSVHDATESAVNSVVKGFERITRPTTELEEKRSKLIEQQNALNRSTREGAQEYDKLQKQIDELNHSLDEYSPKGMQDALQSQLAFMDEYIKNLEKAQTMGLSDDLLASLSDGTAQSAEYLSQLVANPEAAAKVDELFQQVQEKKKGFTDALTAQKLAADDAYAAMVETAKKAISEMDLGEEAKTAMGDTVAGLAQGIADQVPDVREAVNSVLTELNRLSAYGINISLSGFGGLLNSAQTNAGRLLSMGSGSSGFDYDTLGNVMRDNTGGNVYLDGQTVGRVISDQQGKNYRSLERSGWVQ